MNFTDEMIKSKDQLNRLGHEAFITKLAKNIAGKSPEDKERIKLEQKYNKDAIRSFWQQMQGTDAVLVCNWDKNGTKNYIGGNTFLEMGFAHILDQKIYLLNPVPNNELYRTEIIAMKPKVINGDLGKIPK